MRPRLAGLRLELLAALVPAGGRYLPQFLLPAVTYPARGVAQWWAEPPAGAADPLVALVGRTRAALLGVLDLPWATTELAGRLGLSPAAVSQHLKVLRQAGLVSRCRRGRLVLYRRTPAAGTLLEAVHSDTATG